MAITILQSLINAEDVNVDRQSEAARWDFLYARQEFANSASTFGESDTLSSSASGDTASGISTLDARPTQVNAPSQIGLIMPNPYSNVYTGVEYRMGYIDPGPAPRVNGALRLVTPLLTYPNYSTNVFPEVGSLNADPKNHTNEIGWCSVNLVAAPYTFPFRFEKTGWHIFVLNTTWARPTISGDDPSTNCSLPLQQQYTFFGTRAVSVSPSPTTGGFIRAAPAYTVWTDLTWKTPGALPVDKHKDTVEKKTIVGLSIAAVIIAIGAMAGIMWWMRKRRSARREALAISRFGPREQAEYFSQPLPLIHGGALVSPQQMYVAGAGSTSHLRHGYYPMAQPPRQDVRYDPRGW